MHSEEDISRTSRRSIKKSAARSSSPGTENMSAPISRTQDKYERLEARQNNHSLRHSYAGHSRRDDRPSATLSRSLGNSSPRSPAQSAARKSISNVFERLLKEEEQRREEERRRKELARDRRRQEKQKREDADLWKDFPNSVLPSERSNESSSATSGMLSSADKLSKLIQEKQNVVSPSSEQHAASIHENNEGSGEEKHASQRETDEGPDYRSSLLLDAPKLQLDTAEGTSLYNERRISKDANQLSPYSGSSSRGSIQSSPDSVTRFTFPNKPGSSPAASPRYLSPNFSSPSGFDNQQHRTSPRRGVHRRAAGRSEASEVLSMSARVPAMDEKSVHARIESTLANGLVHQNNAEASPNSQDRHVSFSPSLEVIGHASRTSDTDSSTSSADAGSNGSDANERLADLGSPDMIREESTPLRPLRGSPLKRMTASPHFPGTYTSPGPGSLKGDAAITSLRDAPSLRRDRFSLSDQSIQEEVEPDDSDQVVAGQDSVSRHAPLQSTPPRRRSSEGVEGEDDTVQMTLQNIISHLSSGASAADGTLGDALMNKKPLSESGSANKRHIYNTARFQQSAEGTVQETLEVEQRVSAARSRLATLALQVQQQTSTPRKSSQWMVYAVAAVVLQLVFAWLMTLAAHKEAEEMFLTVHYDAFGPTGYTAPPPSPSLLGALLTRAGLWPDLPHHLSPPLLMHQNADWNTLLGHVFRHLYDSEQRTLLLRCMVGKALSSFGYEEHQSFLLGHQTPT